MLLHLNRDVQSTVQASSIEVEDTKYVFPRRCPQYGRERPEGSVAGAFDMAVATAGGAVATGIAAAAIAKQLDSTCKIPIYVEPHLFQFWFCFLMIHQRRLNKSDCT